MAKWIPGQGYWLIQSTGPIDEAANKQRMNELEERLTIREQEIKGVGQNEPSPIRKNERISH